MKKVSLLTILFYAVTALNAQQAITINASDIPIPKAPFNGVTFDGAVTNPVPGTNGLWDVSGLAISGTWQNNYMEETDPYWTSRGVDAYWFFPKHLTSTTTYDTYMEWDFNANGVDEIGFDIPAQAYDISGATGTSGDSIVFPAQYALESSPRRLMKFPMTAGTAWKSISRFEVNFNISVAPASLKKAPGKHVITYYRSDTVVGWGKMKTYTSKGPSKEYDVLMVKTMHYTIDSFYINEAPASPLILAAFGISQGQKMEVNNQYNYYRKGFFNYLVRYWYEANNFTTTTSVFLHSDEVWTNGIAPAEAPYTTMLYPNPVNGESTTLQFMGRSFNGLHYSLTDITGREVGNGTADNGVFSIQINTSGLNNGTYIVKVTDSANNTVAIEKMVVNR